MIKIHTLQELKEIFKQYQDFHNTDYRRVGTWQEAWTDIVVKNALSKEYMEDYSEDYRIFKNTIIGEKHIPIEKPLEKWQYEQLKEYLVDAIKSELRNRQIYYMDNIPDIPLEKDKLIHKGNEVITQKYDLTPLVEWYKEQMND